MTVTCLLVMLVTSLQSINYFVNCSRTHNLHGPPLVTSNQSTPTLSPSPYLGSRLYYAKCTWVCIWLLLFNCQPAKTFSNKACNSKLQAVLGSPRPPGFSNSLGLLGAVRRHTPVRGKRHGEGAREWSLEETRHTFKDPGETGGTNLPSEMLMRYFVPGTDHVNTPAR